jgi:hypothetical protein
VILSILRELVVKQIVASFRVGVTLVSVVLRYDLYLRYRNPLNWLSEAPLRVNKVAPVPSGPTKVNGPSTLLLAAAWNLTVVFGGVFAVHENVVQEGEAPVAGFASFDDETKSPLELKVPFR